jgi:hypothetical protein
VWFIKLITFSCLFVCIKFYLFYFQFNSLSFDFSIEFVVLFYDVLSLNLDVLISNFNSRLFHQILISFQFHHWIHDFFFNVWSSFLFLFLFFWFLFLFWILLWIWFFFSILPFNSIFDDIYGSTLNGLISNFDS